MHAFHAWVLRLSTWYVWLFFFAAYVVFAAYVMPGAAGSMQTACGATVKVPDIEIGYNAADLRSMISQMNTEECRNTYLHIATVTDSVYPLVYGFFFFFSIVFLYYKGKNPSRVLWLYLVPIAAMLFDYAENASLAHIVRQHQNFSDFSANLASALSMLKWLFALAGVLVILVGLGRVLVRVLEGKK